MDFLEALYPKDTVIAGQTVSRCKFGSHLRLMQLAEECRDLLDNKATVESATLMAQSFRIAGFNPVGLDGQELLFAYKELLTLNKLLWLLPFQSQKENNKEHKILPYDYPNRNVAWMIDKLASHYGWTRHYIMDSLYPEEVYSYIQEIIIREHNELEERRMLSDKAWQYDKASKTSRYMPLTKPQWMQVQPEFKSVKMSKHIMPVGLVISANDQIH